MDQPGEVYDVLRLCEMTLAEVQAEKEQVKT